MSSLPNFKSPITLRESIDGTAQTITFSGPLEADEKAREVHVFVMIRQMPKDLIPAGNEPKPIAIASGHDEKVVAAKPEETEWEVTVSVPAGEPQFGPGFATGTALAVEYSIDDDSVGFETYIWTERIELKLPGSTSTSA